MWATESYRDQEKVSNLEIEKETTKERSLLKRVCLNLDAAIEVTLHFDIDAYGRCRRQEHIQGPGCTRIAVFAAFESGPAEIDGREVCNDKRIHIRVARVESGGRVAVATS